MPVEAVFPKYELVLAPEEIAQLGLVPERQPDPSSEVLCLALITVNTEQPPTTNLLAPIVINPGTHRAVQSIQLDSGYSHQHPLSLERTEDAC
jgi:flagellar assembly factor FliW